MRVLVTGATGFVGSHVAGTLLAAGHQPVLFVRSEEKARAVYAKLSLPLPELVSGDVTDPESVARAVSGCDAVVHAAAVTPTNAGDKSALFATNIRGTQHVADAACAQGIDKFVYISSITAVFNTDAAKVTEDAPLTPSTMPYGHSKIAAERYLRGLQEQGKALAIVYPGGVIGPDDPGLSDTFKAMIHRFNEGFRITQGGMQHVDVRDLADVVVTLLEQKETNGRYLLPGPFLLWSELADLLEDVSGFPLQKIRASGWVFRAVGRYYDLKRRFKVVDSPISAETMRYSTQWPNVRTSAALIALGFNYRDPRETFADSLRWLGEQGYLDKRQLVRLFT